MSDNCCTILFRCPRCLTHLKAVDLQAGWQMPCPKCHGDIAVPRPVQVDEAQLFTATAKKSARLLPTLRLQPVGFPWLPPPLRLLANISPLTCIWLSLGLGTGLLLFVTVLCI